MTPQQARLLAKILINRLDELGFDAMTPGSLQFGSTLYDEVWVIGEELKRIHREHFIPEWIEVGDKMIAHFGHRNISCWGNGVMSFLKGNR